jgi:hypothetical protein
MNLDNKNNEVIDIIAIIYENYNIYKSIFIVNDELYDDIIRNLEKNEYPVSGYENLEKFKNNQTRILVIKDIDSDKLFLYENTIHFKEYINMIIFIDTPKFIENNTYYKLLLKNNINNINIIQI